MIFDASLGVQDFYSAGISREQHQLLAGSPRGSRLIGDIAQWESPLRLKDAANYPDPSGVQGDHAFAGTFLGVPIRYRDERIGYMYLSEKVSGPDFTEGDEHIAQMLAAQAASIISNTRRYEEARQARADMETLMDICPVSVSIFDVRSGEIAYMN